MPNAEGQRNKTVLYMSRRSSRSTSTRRTSTRPRRIQWCGRPAPLGADDGARAGSIAGPRVPGVDARLRRRSGRLFDATVKETYLLRREALHFSNTGRARPCSSWAVRGVPTTARSRTISALGWTRPAPLRSMLKEGRIQRDLVAGQEPAVIRVARHESYRRGAAAARDLQLGLM